MSIRVLYVHNSSDIYGASRSLVRLLRTLDREKFEPFVLLPADGPLAAQLRAMAVPVIVFPQLSVITREVFHSWRLLLFALHLPLSALALRRVLRRERIALVHTNTGVILSPGLAAWLSGVPHVWHIRDWFQEFESFWRLSRTVDAPFFHAHHRGVRSDRGAVLRPRKSERDEQRF